MIRAINRNETLIVSYYLSILKGQVLSLPRESNLGEKETFPPVLFFLLVFDHMKNIVINKIW